MKFPLSSSDAFVEQIKLATEVAFTQFHDKILTPDILELVQDAPAPMRVPSDGSPIIRSKLLPGFAPAKYEYGVPSGR